MGGNFVGSRKAGTRQESIRNSGYSIVVIGNEEGLAFTGTVNPPTPSRPYLISVTSKDEVNDTLRKCETGLRILHHVTPVNGMLHVSVRTKNPNNDASAGYTLTNRKLTDPANFDPPLRILRYKNIPPLSSPFIVSSDEHEASIHWRIIDPLNDLAYKIVFHDKLGYFQGLAGSVINQVEALQQQHRNDHEEVLVHVFFHTSAMRDQFWDFQKQQDDALLAEVNASLAIILGRQTGVLLKMMGNQRLEEEAGDFIKQEHKNMQVFVFNARTAQANNNNNFINFRNEQMRLYQRRENELRLMREEDRFQNIPIIGENIADDSVDI